MVFSLLISLPLSWRWLEEKLFQIKQLSSINGLATLHTLRLAITVLRTLEIISSVHSRNLDFVLVVTD